jgi:predicted amidohydrolase YtcJ
MADADVVISGTVLTVDDARPTAPSGRVLGPEERLTVEQAIRAQTIDAAWHLFADDVVGSLEVGKYADLVVLSADPRAVPPGQIADLEVRATYLAGRQVYPQ